ncbi:MAG TPA: cytochrome b/b6 domain-containing protein [Vicinamibacteria bacterium]|jgi:cytochrome b subunit of formate dehydrogenase
MSARASDDVVRFGVRQRLEHAGVMALFVLLALTGFPQKFPEAGWAAVLVDLLGGIGVTRWLHRAAGIGFAALAAVHLGVAVFQAATRRTTLSMVPTRKDFRDVLVMLRYYLGLAAERARFDRFDYREKFEYWGLIFGALIMSATGVVLLFPIAFSNWLAGELIPVAKVAHSQEGLMAFLVVVTWHIYNAHLAPEVFPFNKSIFTGRISREHLRHEHPLEYERLFPEDTGAARATDEGTAAPLPAAPSRGRNG